VQSITFIIKCICMCHFIGSGSIFRPIKDKTSVSPKIKGFWDWRVGGLYQNIRDSADMIKINLVGEGYSSLLILPLFFSLILPLFFSRDARIPYIKRQREHYQVTTTLLPLST
jgi:hypothetical protein